MEQIIFAYGLPKETIAAIMMLYRNTEEKVCSPPKTITDANYADDIKLLANAPAQAETLLHSLEPLGNNIIR